MSYGMNERLNKTFAIPILFEFQTQVIAFHVLEITILRIAKYSLGRY